MSTTGNVMNAGLDLLEGKPVEEVATHAAISIVKDRTGAQIVDKAVDNGVVKEQAESALKAVEKIIED